MLDPLLKYSGWESYENDAKLNFTAYSAHIRVCFFTIQLLRVSVKVPSKIIACLSIPSIQYCLQALLDNYGIPDECQLYSGCFSKIRNRISDRDADDMSQFNTNFVIEQKFTNIFMT